MALSGGNNPHSPFRPMSRSRTTYAGMNQWCKAGDMLVPGHVPITLSDTNFREVSQRELEPEADSDTEEESSENAIPRAVMPCEKRSDEFYRRYQQLANNMAYRFPNIPAPRERQGRIGGSWRHIKEVLGHAGSRVVFVDGLVRLYDYERKKGNTTLVPGPAGQMSRCTPLYGISKNDLNQDSIVQHEYQLRDQPWQSAESFNPGLPSAHMPLSAREPRSKYKGFYQIKRENTYY